MNPRTVLQPGIPALGPVCVLLVVVFLAMGVGSSSAQVPSPEGYVQKSEKGSIDWLNGKATSVGIGAPPPNAVNAAQARAMAQRAAVVIARRNLMELLKGVQLDSTSTVQNFMVADDTVVSKVQGQLEQAEIEDTAYMSDGSVEVTVSVSLRGAMSKTLLPPEQLRGASMPSAPPREKQGPERVDPARTQPQRPSRPAIPGEGGVTPVRATPQQEDFSFGASLGGGYSGLVVDARGLGARPAMSPRIVDEQGREVYGSSLVGREYAIQQGMAGYAKDMDKARENDRVAGNPLLVKAREVTGQAGSDIVVSDDDAERIRHAAAGSEFLKQCRVMIVLD